MTDQENENYSIELCQGARYLLEMGRKHCLQKRVLVKHP